jgi:hypothetical protein
MYETAVQVTCILFYSKIFLVSRSTLQSNDKSVGQEIHEQVIQMFIIINKHTYCSYLPVLYFCMTGSTVGLFIPASLQLHK